MKTKTLPWYVFVPLALLGATAALALPQAAPAASAAPQVSLTELEQTKLENLQLKFSLLQQQQAQLQSQYQALVQQIQHEHPGFAWDAQRNLLVPVPPVKPAAHSDVQHAPLPQK